VEAIYDNGNRRVVSADRSLVSVSYYNGDVKETLADGTVKYYYAQTKTWHLTYPGKREVLKFAK
jgi:centromere protein J